MCLVNLLCTVTIKSVRLGRNVTKHEECKYLAADEWVEGVILRRFILIRVITGILKVMYFAMNNQNYIAILWHLIYLL